MANNLDNARLRRCPGPLIRVIGTGLLVICALTIKWLLSRQAGVHHHATMIEMLAGAFSFLAGSIGAALTWLGGHCYDEIQISGRWMAHNREYIAGIGGAIERAEPDPKT
jgi:hypothetical protein